MITNFTNTPNTYLIDRYNFILMVEERGKAKLKPYIDSKGWVTIGCGFNLHDPNVRSQVLTSMGIIDGTTIAKLTDYLSKNQSGKSNKAIQDLLDGVVATAFGFDTEDQVKTLFNDGPNGNDGLAQKYETIVDTWSVKSGLGIIPPSTERLALLSLAYNTPALLGSGLAQDRKSVV
jgi:hypothetical protein